MPFGVTLKSFDSLEDALKQAQSGNSIGVTQGGSSRKNSGARVAAREANVQQKPSN